MANGTWAEAIVCPKCGMTGEVPGERSNVTKNSGDRTVTRGAVLHQAYCRNSRCRWYNTPWTIQVNPDGTIPDPDAPRQKRYGRVDPVLAETMRQRFDAIEEAMNHGLDGTREVRR